MHTNTDVLLLYEQNFFLDTKIFQCIRHEVLLIFIENLFFDRKIEGRKAVSQIQSVAVGLAQSSEEFLEEAIFFIFFLVFSSSELSE